MTRELPEELAECLRCTFPALAVDFSEGNDFAVDCLAPMLLALFLAVLREESDENYIKMAALSDRTIFDQSIYSYFPWRRHARAFSIIAGFDT